MPLTAEQLTWVTGLSENGDAIDPEDLTVLGRLDSTSAIVAGHLTTYARLAGIIPHEQDWPFLIRVVRESRLAADRLTDPRDIDAFHLEPPTTGYAGWDALLAGVAEMTGVDRVSDTRILAWCHDRSRFSPDLFDPLATGKYLWLEYLRTPIQLRVRNVVLAAGNLEGV